MNRQGEQSPVVTSMFQLDGVEFIALNGGPMFSFSQAVSFFVSVETHPELDNLWKNLTDGGVGFMELGKYPFSEKFGWVQDKFGTSWQLHLGRATQRITPFLMFVGAQHGKAEQAMNYYISLFKDSGIIKLLRYGKGEPEPEGTVKHAIFSLNRQEFMAINSKEDHPFTFTAAISFSVKCETQQDVDELWENLSEGGEQQRCGVLKDRYGVSWQIIPIILGKLLYDKDPVKSKRVLDAMLTMNKIDTEKLQQAYDEE